ncbi:MULTISPECIES: TonB-dependent receptor domain-containing protein [Alteromonadaceae]|uniref:TonB-dependent receptor n=1 Tax=Brumicola blandensis TaxID=3075611 RepID=A0AAW8QXX0_9ALTE|nr:MULTISPECIES: TonB-dependent receptor [unclassified Alteromonas]MDT0581619.1 TonB-dependent receptor [Alteromonas sp. W409]MDT0627194.1 TonB-dependent receptor [Alteromonas sp. W364]
MKSYKLASLAICISAALQTTSLSAQEVEKNEAVLETITVTAQKRVQSIQDVPISIATLNGEKFESIFSGGEDILALAVRVPGLYAESSNGRVAPRFYIRGLGNTDFDLAASQPVSIIMDDVVKENVVLKSFPLFDIEQVEVIRGPQGTLFGRNTTAGIIKFDSVKPSEDFDAYGKVAFGSFGTVNVEGAVGGGLADNIAGRFSFLSQQRDDYIDNAFSGEDDVIGGYDELAWRAQLLFTPTAELDVLVNLHGRDLEGTASIFRANVFTRGSNDLNENYDRDTVYYDGNLLGNGFDNNPQEYENFGFSVKVDYDFDEATFTSITANEEAEGFSLGDVDGGAGSGDTSVPGFIPFTAVTQDKLNDLEQFTQEFRLASNSDDALSWQVGAFYYDSSFNVTSIDGFFGATTVFHENTTWAVFGQSTYEVSEKLTVTGGLRYTEDEKSLRVGDQNVDGFALVIDAAQIQEYAPINVDDGQVGYELSANYKLDENTSLFARYANGFRAQSIQGRDVAFEGAPSVAEAETINSVEVGFKSDLLDDSLRLNAAAFYYVVDDIQFSAIGGGANNTALINADKGTAFGFEIDATYIVNDNLVLTGGYSYNNTEIKDDSLSVFPCGANADFGGNCRVLNPRTDDNRALIDGNPFPQAPETIFNFTARYSIPAGENGEIFAYTDWAFQGKTNLFLYDSVEFQTDDNVEGGLRIGYENFEHNYSIALYSRNITDEDNVKGAIDFNNLTGIVNEPRVIGIEGKISFF